MLGSATGYGAPMTARAEGPAKIHKERLNTIGARLSSLEANLGAFTEQLHGARPVDVTEGGYPPPAPGYFAELEGMTDGLSRTVDRIESILKRLQSTF